MGPIFESDLKPEALIDPQLCQALELSIELRIRSSYSKPELGIELAIESSYSEPELGIELAIESLHSELEIGIKLRPHHLLTSSKLLPSKCLEAEPDTINCPQDNVHPHPHPHPHTHLHPRLNSKLLTGAFLIFLSLLIFLAIIKDLPCRTPWPAYKPLPSASTWFESFTPHSTPRTPQKAIRKTLKTISALILELNRTLTTTCPGCVWRTASGEVCVRTFYDDGDVVLFVVVGWLIVTLCSFGTWVFLGGVADIAPNFEARVENWGLGGASVVAAAVAFGGLRARWYWCVLFVLGAAFGGMVLGVFVTPEKQLVKWKEEMRAEAENLAYAERQTGR
ncbi:hypothetical protein VE01_05230 [Pseudogymnoascus verrucosus]|uniref:Uncharacterized protein n=1 Tax=Pseudogymnoascus verrucosus TaxID=342668 RepID=A0A1B8GHY7_9PEZI|nr:uncharacterized protein VE01_05230 [Pseudogymnoascus verrucosus]OBT95416.1 hypothetical protein VE01_05230 [Pseudogymnoascus verrucosus]